MFKTRKPTPALLKEDELRMQQEETRISQLDPNSKAAQRRAAFYERCKVSDTKLANMPQKKKYYNKKQKTKKTKTGN